MPSSSDASSATADATPSGRTDVEAYWLMRRAFRDAIWDVVGSVLKLVLAWTLFTVGAMIVVSGLSDPRGTTGLVVAAFGLVLSLGAVVYGLRELRIFPFD